MKAYSVTGWFGTHVTNECTISEEKAVKILEGFKETGAVEVKVERIIHEDGEFHTFTLLHERKVG